MQSFHRFAGPPAFAESDVVLTERVLSLGRALIVLVSLLAIVTSPDPGRYPLLVWRLLVAFTVLTEVWVFIAWKAPLKLHAWAAALHAQDLVWAVVITTFTDGSASIFFAFFVYVLVAAAYRWGLAEAVMTAIVANVLIVVQMSLLSQSPQHSPAAADWSGLVVRGPLLILLAAFIGYLAREQKRLQRDAAISSALVGSAQVESGVRNSLAVCAGEVLRAFGSIRLWAILSETTTLTTVLCDARRQKTGVELTLLPLSASEAAAWEFAPSQPCDAFLVRRRGGLARRRPLWKLWPSDKREAGGTIAPVLADGAWQAALGAHVSHGEWSARIVVLDPAPAERRAARAGFLHRALSHAAPAFHGLNLMQRLRSRVGAIERARVARELHDGVIQSLSSLDMQIEAARRQLDTAPDAVPAALERAQAVVREEVLNVRDLMQQLRHTAVDPRRVVEHMTELVERFRRDTGVAATFVCTLPDPELPRNLARELVRMLQETLVNIRKHSGAASVVVRFLTSDDSWCLIVDDDGRGFDFDGRYTLEELDAARRGPVVLKERVRSVNAKLWITSEPGRGTRIEIQVPQSGHAG